jgi:hypothetical protein
MFFGPDKYLQVSKCLFAMWSVTSEARRLRTYDRERVTQLKPDSTRKSVEKTVK